MYLFWIFGNSRCRDQLVARTFSADWEPIVTVEMIFFLTRASDHPRRSISTNQLTRRYGSKVYNVHTCVVRVQRGSTWWFPIAAADHHGICARSLPSASEGDKKRHVLSIFLPRLVLRSFTSIRAPGPHNDKMMADGYFHRRYFVFLLLTFVLFRFVHSVCFFLIVGFFVCFFLHAAVDVFVMMVCLLFLDFIGRLGVAD